MELPPSPLKMTPGSVLCIEKERKTASKLHLPDTVKSKQEWGHKEFLVIAVGDGRILENGGFKPMSVKVGDRVMPMFNQVLAFDFADEKYLAMPMEAIIGIEDTTVMTALDAELSSKFFAQKVSQ